MMKQTILFCVGFLCQPLDGLADTKNVRPNIVFVLFDDMGYGQPPSYRADSPFKTPNIDRLTRQGMRFTDAHSAAANCTPTRYGVLTGRYPCRIGQYGVLSCSFFLNSRFIVFRFLTGWFIALNADEEPGILFNIPLNPKALFCIAYCNFLLL